MGGAPTGITRARRRTAIGWLADEGFVPPSVDEQAITDIQFELKGTRLPRDHGRLLFQALARLAPWMENEDLGIHPIQGADLGDGNLMLNRRARLTIRASRERAADLLALTGKTFELAGNPFEIGPGKLRPLSWHTPLYAHCVTTGSSDEKAFAQDIMRLLDEFHIDSRFICGRRQTLTGDHGEEHGYSLMLHGLPIEHALLIQQQGLGTNRKYGCGIFIPHKSITAVS